MSEQQKYFSTQDGTSLFYRYRPAADGSSDKAIVLFHRGHEHSGRMMFVADELGFDDFSYFAWDARGHGYSPGERGDSPSIGTSVSDVDDFIRHIQSEYGIKPENICVIAQSVGAVLVSTWLHDYAPKIRCAVLASPAFKVKLYVPFARTGLKIMQKWRGNFFVNSYVKAHYLTHNVERQKSYDNDPLIAHAISVRILLGLYEAAERVVADAQAITTPVQLLISGNDWVVHHKPQHDFYNRLGSHIKERHILPGFYHDTLGEQNREIAFVEMRRFIRERFNQPLQQVDLTQAHLFGDSRREADELATPLPVCMPRGAFWATYRASLKLGSRWSEGLRIGQETGFDSGSTLDYVYRNQPQGSNAFGVWVDKYYLNAIGWRGIRQRKVNIGKAIQTASAKLREAGKPVHVLDIASGHGRYVLDALTADTLPDSVRLRDYSPINVEAGRKLIAERGLQEMVTFNEVNAYDRANYHDLQPRPTLGIVSGLHELFADNDLILNSLYGFGEAIETGGYLIYTGQPWHPQLEMIARALTSHKAGSPNWVMRRRSQQEMDQLVEKAGFEKIHQWIDEDGIFTVSLAVKK
ncbi:alpha/beta fold hydrolase [Neisseria flavescens]|uniref:Hydrolase, alpha/beta domain protein n=2 Tax=Neisseria TaxID=482 RepID=C0ENS6_NEIFL|nr:bifunctional alpha/beta hydrolase/class I SAM-dependent methyltransferase [Neisseria flavescens]SPY04109.1 Phospholipase ytpA [Neisseria meningitidis]EEG33274.1 hydrolase, alpha/beta domain protein [Neisseria flavescens NRL30031/H210]QCL69240.1 alpha/beta fold hydrolase [Neisseria flavescens]SPY05639.1 Phospholipase ytpA [Neisseria meningitidis]STZ65779.1 Phospholipase ytpA [Neisseria flavescens]